MSRRVRLADGFTVETGSYQSLPLVYTEVVEVDPAALERLGLAGVDGLEGWKIFKKISHAFSKVGKSISKLKISKILKVAIPILAGGLLVGFGGLSVSTIAKKFGKKAALLVASGRKNAQRVRRPDGSESAVLLNPAELAKVRAVVKDPNQAITEEALSKILGRSIADLYLPGSVVKQGMLEVPVFDDKPTVEEKTIPVKLAGIGAAGIAAAAVGLALAFGGRRGRRS